jgi:hypothetical protein
MPRPTLPTPIRSLTRRLGRLSLALALLTGSVAPALAADAGPQEQHVARDLVVRALSLLGVNYKFGGNTPETGLDCSGLVRYVFHEAAGLILPRRAEEISRAGEAIGREQLRPGDLVFFNTLRRTFSHVGIYIGDGRFVHAPSAGGEVRVESLSASYWRRRFNGARRMLAGSLLSDPEVSRIVAAVGSDAAAAPMADPLDAASPDARPSVQASRLPVGVPLPGIATAGSTGAPFQP